LLFFLKMKFVLALLVLASAALAVDTHGYGYYVFGRDMTNVDLNLVASHGTTDLFLNFYAFTAHGKSAVESWIASANKVGIRVHIWMQVFNDGEWHNPIDTSFQNQRIEEAKEYASVKGVSGVHCDYLRYPGNAYKTPGGTAAVSRFARRVTEEVHNINPNIIVSAALMPEPSAGTYYYGQNYSALSAYLDVVLPMVYKGNYHQDSSWIGSTTEWYVENSKGAAVWTTLQSYRSDDDATPLSSDELTRDAKIASKAGASGVVSFRYGLSAMINFKDL